MYESAGCTEVECTKGEDRPFCYVSLSFAVIRVVKGNLTQLHSESVSRTAFLIYSRLQTSIELAVLSRWMKLRCWRKLLLFCLFSPALCSFCLANRLSHSVKISVSVKVMRTCILVWLVSSCMCEVSVEYETWLVDCNAQ
jgi:hypothetical protein